MAVAITNTANPAGVSHTANVTTYSGVSTGAAVPGRITVVAIGKEVATVAPTGVTLNDGSGATAMTLIAGNTFGNMGAWLYYLPMEWRTPTTADIAVTWSGAITNTQNHIAVYTVTDAIFPATSSGTDTSTDMDATDPLTTGSTTIPAGGGMLALASTATNTTTKTWTNLTIDLNTDTSAFKFTTGTSTTAGTATRTCQGSTNGEDGVLAWVTFSPSAIAGLPPVQPTMRPPGQ